MEITVDLILLVLAAICFLVAAFGVTFAGRPNVSIGWLGLFLWVLAAIIPG